MVNVQWAVRVEAESSLSCGHEQLTVLKHEGAWLASELDTWKRAKPRFPELQILCSTSVSVKLACKICLSLRIIPTPGPLFLLVGRRN